jgi:hypothetical protein
MLIAILLQQLLPEGNREQTAPIGSCLPIVQDIYPENKTDLILQKLVFLVYQSNFGLDKVGLPKKPAVRTRIRAAG